MSVKGQFQAPKDVPILSIGRTVLNLSQELMRQLSSVKCARIDIEDGRPVIIPDRNGWTISKRPGELAGMMKAPAVVKKVTASLPIGSKWQMEYDRKRRVWVGTAYEQERVLPMSRQLANALPARKVPVLVKETMRRLAAAGVIEVKVPEAELLRQVQTISDRAWTDIRNQTAIEHVVNG